MAVDAGGRIQFKELTSPSEISKTLQWSDFSLDGVSLLCPVEAIRFNGFGLSSGAYPGATEVLHQTNTIKVKASDSNTQATYTGYVLVYFSMGDNDSYYKRFDIDFKVIDCTTVSIVTSTVQDPAYVLMEVFVDAVSAATTPQLLPIDLSWWATTVADCPVTSAVMVVHSQISSDGTNLKTTESAKSSAASYTLQFTLTEFGGSTATGSLKFTARCPAVVAISTTASFPTSDVYATF